MTTETEEALATLLTLWYAKGKRLGTHAAGLQLH